MQQDKKYIVALDQGTTSSRAIIFDRETNIISSSQKAFTQIYPQPGWVEHDPIDIWETQIYTLTQALTQAGISNNEIAAIGITNQRETTLVWDKNSGLPLYNAIVWQCRRTANTCEEIKQQGLEPYIKETTGL
ncbi:MAG: glycerol kinase, partial [Alteromonadales bacterium]|nr:glycerol kinase [Alteromonadales bacterium]